MHSCCIFLALVLVTKAIIQDHSIIEVGEEWISKFRLQILGIVQSLARRMCKESCKVGADNVKRIRCPELCGIAKQRLLRCFLCFPDKIVCPNLLTQRPGKCSDSPKIIKSPAMTFLSTRKFLARNGIETLRKKWLVGGKIVRCKWDSTRLEHSPAFCGWRSGQRTT